jgi:SAM-dependent methyltransferase
LHNFTELDADDWYHRNSSRIEGLNTQALDVQFIFDTLKGCSSEISNFLEIGCSSGQKTQLIAQLFQAQGWGVDISATAIQKALERTSGMRDTLTFVTGRGSDLDFKNGSMDLIFLGFFCT